jgi:hypothetical protein
VQVQNWCRCPNKTTLHAHSRCRAMQCGNLGPSSIEQSREKAQRHNRHHAFNIICHATSKCSFAQRQVQHTETATSNRVRVGQQSHRRHRSCLNSHVDASTTTRSGNRPSLATTQPIGRRKLVNVLLHRVGVEVAAKRRSTASSCQVQLHSVTSSSMHNSCLRNYKKKKTAT